MFDKKETMFDKMTAGVVGKLTKSIVTKFVSGIENNQSNPLGKNPWRGAAMLIVDQEIPIQPISKKNTNGKKQRQSYESIFQIRASLADCGLFPPAHVIFHPKNLSLINSDNLKSITSGKIFSFSYKNTI